LISPNPANEGEEVEFSGYGNDDGFILDYEWFSDLEGKVLSNSASFAISDLMIGLHEISFRVMDNDMVWSEHVITQIRINQIPTAQIDYVSPGFSNEGEVVTFSGRGFDDGDITSYYWYSTIDGFLSQAKTFSSTHLSIGNHDIYFRVQDDFGIWSQEVSVSIKINQKPQAVIDLISPLVPNEGEIVNFTGYGIDDGTITAFNWTSNIDGFLSGSQSFNYSAFSLGEHVITLRVKDNDNVWSEGASRQLRINKMPTAQIIFITPQPALWGSSVSFSGLGIDDREITEYFWSSSKDGYLGNSESFMWYGLSEGQHAITFKVKDDDDIWSEEKTFSLKIHSAPTAKILSITPDAPNEGEVIWFEGEGEDDGFIKSYKWTSNIDGELSSDEVFTALLTPGQHTISFSVMDDNNEWSKVVARRVTINKLPEAEIDIVSPNPSYLGDEVTFSGHGEDDGIIMSYQWTSSIDGVIGTESSIYLMDLSLGTHSIYFKVKDNLDVWSQEAYTTLTVQMRDNLEPTVSFVNPKNGETVYDDIFIHVQAQDEIHEIERIEIKVDDDDWFKISDSAVAYYSMDSRDMSEGNHVIYARAYDGELYSDEEFIIIDVEHDKEGGGITDFDASFLIILLIIIVPIIAAILLYWILVVRKRRKRDFIRL
jgi:hypothetical protein